MAQRFAGQYDDFLAGLRSEGTRTNYRYSITWVLGKNPDAFLALASKNRQKGERQLIEFIRANRDRVASATIVNPIMAVRSFCDYNEVVLNWKKVRRELPPHQKVAMDRAPTYDEIRKLLSFCDLRMRAAVLIMVSSGVRVGAFDYLKLGDVKFLDSGIMRMLVYEGTPDRYYAFASSEAVAALKEYLASREAIGEPLKPDSPILRDKWDFDDRLRKIKRSTLSPQIPTRFDSKALRNWVGYLWIKSGVRQRGIRRGEFQQVHGFRKFFKTQASKGIQRPEVVETLMGHVTNYFKVTPEELANEYLSAQPHLLVTEAAKANQEKAKLETEQALEIQALKEQLNAVLTQVGALRDKVAAKVRDEES
ncbi:MAG: site-specific integrase [Nitrososphaerota archaeon]|nr:site-specific integrase [Nitrososphaerota archaeon]